MTLLVLATSAWIGWRTYQAYTHLTAASAAVARLQDDLRDITTADPDVTAATVAQVQAEATAARSAVEDPIYRAGTFVPFAGPNLQAISTVTVTVESLGSRVLPSLVEVARTLQPSALAPRDGTLDLAPISRISPLLQDADAAVRQASAGLAGIDRSALVTPVGDAVGSLTGKLQDASAVTGPGARTARLLPPMLGGAGLRRYLVVFQNPAELRATGGIFGSYALITADQGKVSIVEQGAASRNLGAFDSPVGQLDPGLQSLYGDQMTRIPQNVNVTPDFPTAANLFVTMYRQRTGTTVDGVLAIDPVALSYLLQGTDGVDVGQGITVTSGNLVQTLLSTAYQRFDDSKQTARDEFLDNATAKVFTTIMSGKGDPRSIVNGLRRAVDERRVLLYSAAPAEQADLGQTGVAGLVIGDPSTAPALGVFLNDTTGAKLDYYLHGEVQVGDGGCRPDGRREMRVRVSLRFDAPSAGLPSYVSGVKNGRPYVLRTTVMVFAPAGGEVVGADRDGAPVAVGAGQDHSRPVGTVATELTPGTTAEVVYTVLGPPGAAGTPADLPPTLALTPGVNPWVSSVTEFPPCRSRG